MKRISALLIAFFVATIVSAQTADDIRGIQGIVAWYSADSVHISSGSSVDILYDKSGNGHNAVQSVATKQPTLVATDETINNQPTLSFDGGDYLVSNFGEVVSQPNTIFVIWKSTTASTTSRMCYTGLTGDKRNQLITYQNLISMYGGGEIKAPQSSAFDYTIYRSVFNGTISSLSINGQIAATGNAGNYAMEGLTIGSYINGSFGIVGNIAELIFVNGILPAEDSTIVMDYLRNKYAPVPSLHDIEYKASGTCEINVARPWLHNYRWSDGVNDSIRTFATNGVYKLTATDRFGIETTDSVVISFANAKSLKDTAVCYGEDLLLNPNLPNDITYQWSDGSSLPTLSVSSNGRYWVKVTDKVGNYWYSDTISVYVDNLSQQQLFDDNIALCKGDSLSATLPQVGEYSYVWNTGASSPKICINQSGEYSLVVTNSNGCSVSCETNVTIRGVSPYTYFESDTVLAGEVTSFFNNSAPLDNSHITGYSWYFGDGEVSSDANPSHKYALAGKYTTKLEAETDAMCVGTYITKTIVQTNPAYSVKSIAPVQNARVYDSNVLFKWHKVSQAASYQIQVATDENFLTIIKDEVVNDTVIRFNFLSNGQYYWRVKSNLGEYQQPYSFKIVSLSSIPNIVAWYSADSVHISSGSSVDILYDKSGNGHNAVQSVATKQPTMVATDETINNQPTLSFDGGDYLVAEFGEVVAQPNTVIVIWKSTTASTASRMCYTGLSGDKRNQLVTYQNLISMYGGGELKAPQSSVFDYTIYQSDYNGASSRLLVNGQTIATGNVGNQSMAGITLGAYMNGALGVVGNITELIFVNGILSSADSSIVMDYLRNKYAPAPSLQNMEFKAKDSCRINVARPWLHNYRWSDGVYDSIRTFATNGVYKLTVTDRFGIETTDSVVISFANAKSLKDTAVCYGEDLLLNPNLPNDFTYQWSDGSCNATLAVSNFGQYWVKVTDKVGNSWHSDTITVTIDDFPVRASLGADTIRACEGNYIYLADGYESATTYLWSTGDTTNHFEIKNSGLYSVNVVNSRGCRASDTAYYHVEGIAPSVNFAHDSLCQSRNVRFTNLSHSNDQSPITTYHWLFGNGDTSTQQNPDYTYQSSGKYEVKLTVECQNGCANEARKQLTVWQLPKTNFVPNVVCSNTESQLFSRSTSPDDTISLWQWTIGGFGYSDQNPQLQFADAGKVDAILVVTTAHGCTDTVSKTITIHKGPEADFNVGPICLDAPISLTNATVNYLNLAVDYSWKIDDDDFSIMRNAEVVLHDTMPHNVIMTVRQHSNGCESSVHKTIQAKSRPSASFEANDVCANSLPVIITAQGKNIGNLDCVWAVDSLPKIFGQSVKLTNLNVGEHTATLVATDAYGCHDTASAFFNVLPDVQAAFVTDVTNGTVPLLVTFNNTTNQISEFNWDFGDGYSATERNVQHIYADSGLFNVTLTSTTANGCVTKAQKQISTRVAHSNLAIAFAQANEVANYIEIEATIINKGTVDEHNVLINCTNNLGLDITEVLPDTIFAHKVLQHKLNVRLNSRDLQNLEFVCLGIQSNNSDEDESDNEFCISFTENRFVVLQPKPNPATDHVNLEFVTQDGGNAQLAVYNANGEQLMSQNVDVESGIVRIKIDVSTLPAGNYVCILRHNGHVSKQRFVVMRGN